MASCPNCSFMLVLLEKRRKYKCAKCGRLYWQKVIDDREFRNWNKRQRQVDKESIKPPRRKLLTEEEKEQHKRKYYYQNRDKLLKYQREFHSKNKEKRNLHKQKWRQQRLEEERTRYRIRDWRKRQRMLALQTLENGQEKAYNTNPLTPTAHYPTFLSTEEGKKFINLKYHKK